jgi:hypothetical protein
MSINDLNKFLAEELQEPLAIVCHDAGATNYILAWLHFYSKANQGKSINWRLVLQGPALRIWRDNPIVGVTLVPDVKIALNGARALLSGTGWATDLEMGARETASILGVPSIAVLDHWVNYKERFIRGQVLSLPQQIWVADQYAFEEAQRQLPGIMIKMLPNIYLQNTVAEIQSLTDQKDVLYLLEPIRSAWSKNIMGGEFDALDFFIANRHLVDNGQATKIRLRPHPSDVFGKYNHWISLNRNLGVCLDESSTLSEAISNAKWVVGAETFGMVVALEAGRTVMSTLPPYAHNCRLPHQGILRLREMLNT